LFFLDRSISVYSSAATRTLPVWAAIISWRNFLCLRRYALQRFQCVRKGETAGAKASQAKHPSIYGVHPGVATVQKWVAGLEQKTGRSLHEWTTLVKEDRITRRMASKAMSDVDDEFKKWLKTAYDLDI
jgi:hypothetical protein